MVILFLGMEKIKDYHKEWQIILFLSLNFFTSTQATLLQMEIFLIFYKEKMQFYSNSNIYNIHIN